MRTIILNDKTFRVGSVPISDKNGNDIGFIKYKFLNFKYDLEIQDKNNETLFYGGKKIISLLPQWVIKDKDGNEVGIVKRSLSFGGKKFSYTNGRGRSFLIEAAYNDREFVVKDDRGEMVVSFAVTNRPLSFKAHCFSIHIMDDNFNPWDAINMVQGVRTLVREENNKNSDDGDSNRR